MLSIFEQLRNTQCKINKFPSEHGQRPDDVQKWTMCRLCPFLSNLGTRSLEQVSPSETCTKLVLATYALVTECIALTSYYFYYSSLTRQTKNNSPSPLSFIISHCRNRRSSSYCHLFLVPPSPSLSCAQCLTIIIDVIVRWNPMSSFPPPYCHYPSHRHHHIALLSLLPSLTLSLSLSLSLSS